MESQKQAKPKRRRKKNKSRTEVSPDSDSDYEIKKPAKSSTPPPKPSPETQTQRGPKSDAEISTAFTQFYMQRATKEFAEDLDKIRVADDFRDDSVGILVGALRQGVEGFSAEERRRVVTAGEGGEAGKSDQP